MTESLYVDDIVGRTGVLRELRSMGVRIAIDDFGTGYSSLGSLSDMPVDVLKIDKSFIDHIVTSPEAARLVRMILQLADDLHLRTVAEGAEDLDQVQLLRAMGVRRSRATTSRARSRCRSFLLSSTASSRFPRTTF